jgi:hypothetical protein
MGRLPRFSWIGLVAGVALFGQLACSGDTTKSFDLSNNGQTTSVSPGEELDITLSYIGGRGYTGPDVSTSAVEYQGSSVVAPVNPGGPTVQFKFRSVTSGAATISIPYTSPVAGAATLPPYTLNVNVD